MNKTGLTADLHVHSKYSTRPSQWILQKLGCPESFSEPLEIYETAKLRGMDLVTITDHNTLEGSLAIAHLDNTFISEEITTYFPEDRCKAHVLAFDITEAQHLEISRVRENIFDLVKYLQQEDIIHVLAHPLFGVNDRLTIEHFEIMVLLFKNFELNGARDDSLNQVLARILLSLNVSDIHVLSGKHGIEPAFEKPWIKNLTGGSDDHSSLNIARAYTHVEGAAGIKEFLQGILQGRSLAKVRPATPKTLSHNLYSIAYQFYKNKFSLDRYVSKDVLLRFVDRIMTNTDDTGLGLLCRLQNLIGPRKPFSFFRSQPANVQNLLLTESRKIICTDPDLNDVVEQSVRKPWETEENWYNFCTRASDTVLTHMADNLLESFSGAKLFDIFQTIGSAGSLYAILAPYFMSFTLFTKDRHFSGECLKRFSKQTTFHPGKLNVALFTDTFDQKNNLGHALQIHRTIAREKKKQLTLLTCGLSTEVKGVENFTPIGTFTFDEYPGFKLYYPPFLKMLNFCFERKFTHIHAATPGPIGMVALGIARILKLPIYATYHASFPRYIAEATEDTGMEDTFWRYLSWYYNQMDVVYVPSEATRDEITAQGVFPAKIKLYPKGVDVARFTPEKRNGFFASRFSVQDDFVKLLYVGRIAQEKNMDILVSMFTNLSAEYDNLHLVIVGEGPCKSEMQRLLKGKNVTFTGYLQGKELTEAYSSSDIFVFPCTQDTFADVVLEAQSSGLPVIVPDRGGSKENCLPGETGFVVGADQQEEFVGAVARLVENPGLRKTMGKKAREYMVNRSFEATFVETWELYKSSMPVSDFSNSL